MCRVAISEGPMIRIVAPLAGLTAALALAEPVYAAGSLTRTFVSSAGSDSNPCTTTQPCATFAAAYAAVASGGIVAALDPGKYGPLNITSPVTINGNGWSGITAPGQSNGITVTAGSGAVTLIGLEIDGAGAAYNGIVVNSAGSLTVTNCTLQNFVTGGAFNTGNGILMQPTSGTFDFTVTHTMASNNGGTGVYYYPESGSPNAVGVIDHVVANANFTGISVYTENASGGTTVVTMSNTTASDNRGNGIWIQGATAPVTASIDNVTASGNSVGVYVFSAGFSTNVLLGRSVITGNAIGLGNGTSPSAFYTYKDNRINLNLLTDGTNTLNTSFSQQ